MKTRFSTLDQEKPAMKIQVWEKQYPSDKSSLDDMKDMTDQEYDKTDTENQKDFSDDIKVRSNFKVNHASYFCEETF